MKATTITPIALGLLLAYGAAAQAQVAGSVLVAVGETTALRKGQEIRLTAGAPIETGDTLRVGEASNMQVRFTDEAIVALRPNTIFQVEDYAFANKAESDKSIFALIKGGIRTITGLIGRHSRNNYAVKSETSTIGIRGTHYTLVSCRDDYVCRDVTGAAAPNGTYGGVTDGRIAATNQAGEREFGKDEYFYVASATELPMPLMAPPSFLRDRLEGQAKAPGKGSKENGQEQAGKGDEGNTQVSTKPTATTEAPTQVTTQQVSTAAAEQPAVTGTAAPAFHSVAAAAAYGTTGHYVKAEAGDTTESPYSTAQVYGVMQNPSSYTGTPPLPPGHAEDLGHTSAAGNAYWGVVFRDGDDKPTGIHMAFGDGPTNVPTSGIYTYNHVGGTRPRDNFSGVGSWNANAAMSIDFSSKLISTVGSWGWTIGGRSYTLVFSGISYDHATNSDGVVVAGSGSAGYPINPAGSTFTVSGGSPVTGYGVWLNGTFAGEGAAGAYVSIGSQHTEEGVGIITTASAQVFGKGSSSSGGGGTTYPYSDSYTGAHAGTGNFTYTSSTGTTSSDKYASAGAYQHDTTYHHAPASNGGGGSPTVVSSTYTPGATVDQGSDATAGNLSWYRYSYQSSTSYSDGSSHGGTSWDHYVTGDRPTAMPTSGMYTFNWIGGTRPTDSEGHVGTVTSGGSWSVDFATKTVATVTPVSWNVNGVSYDLSVPAQALTWHTSTYTPPDGSYTSTTTQVLPITNVNLTCSAAAACTPNPGQSSVAPGFFGANAQGMGVGYATSVNVGGTDQHTAHIQVYRR